MKQKNIFEAIECASPDGIAIEALIQAETEYLNNPIFESYDDGINKMAFKDDDGYWRITGDSRKFNDYEELLYYYPSVN